MFDYNTKGAASERSKQTAHGKDMVRVREIWNRVYVDKLNREKQQTQTIAENRVIFRILSAVILMEMNWHYYTTKITTKRKINNILIKNLQTE